MRLLAALTAIVLIAPASFAQARPFSYEDYLRYFSPGRFATKSTYYASVGVSEVVSNKTGRVFQRPTLEQTMESFDVSPNYDLSSPYPYYKLKSRMVERLVWDNPRQAWLFEYSAHEFDSDTSLVWESHDQQARISPGDRAAGMLHDFYKRADERAERNSKEVTAEYRRTVVGVWTWACHWLPRGEYEVECISTHVETGRPEDYSFRRIDQLS